MPRQKNKLITFTTFLIEKNKFLKYDYSNKLCFLALLLFSFIQLNATCDLQVNISVTETCENAPIMVMLDAALDFDDLIILAPNANIVANSTTQSYTLQYANSGFYRLDVVCEEDTFTQLITINDCTVNIYLDGVDDDNFAVQNCNSSVTFDVQVNNANTTLNNFLWYEAIVGSGAVLSADANYNFDPSGYNEGDLVVVCIETGISNCINCASVDCIDVEITACIPTSLNDFENENQAFLGQNFPNPFLNNTKIEYFVPLSANTAKLVFTDINGSIIKTMAIQIGEGNIDVNISGLPYGMYSYTLIVDENALATKRMLILE